MIGLKGAEKRYEQYARELELAAKNEAPEDLLRALRESVREMDEDIRQFSDFFDQKYPEI